MFQELKIRMHQWRLSKWMINPICTITWKKNTAMAILMFLILLNQNLIRGIRDSIIVTKIGAEVISFIKLFVEMPIGILCVLVYGLLTNRYSGEIIFRLTLCFFLFFFVVFGFFLCPYHLTLESDIILVDRCISLFPSLKWFFVMWQKWPLIIFYVICELWPVVIFTLLYWQLAHKVTRIEEAGRSYFLFNLVGQSNLLISGTIMIYISKNGNPLSCFLQKYYTDGLLKVTSVMSIVVLLCLCIIALHGYIEQKIVVNLAVRSKKKAQQLGLWQSFKTVFNSSYLGLICVLMASYSMVIGLIEGLWLHQVRLLYASDPNEFVHYQGKVLFWTGAVTLCSSFLGTYLIQSLRWMGTALITPIATLLVGLCFFFLVLGYHFDFLPQTIAHTPLLVMIVATAALQHILIKGTKYSFFDVTKEMAYLPLDHQMQTKGKAAVDILGGKLGKSCGSIIQIVGYMLCPTATPNQLSPFLMIMFVCISLIWIWAVHALSSRYKHYTLKS